MTVLVTGFGAFPGVPDNPSAQLARAIDGAEVLGHRVHGLVIPVSYTRGPGQTVEQARALGATLVLGIGVAMQRPLPTVERVGRRCAGASLDVDGCCEPALSGAEVVPATLDVERLARGLDAGISEDAGTYVCNAWLYLVASALHDVPVGFLHIPASGLPAERLQAGIASLLDGS